MNILSLDLELNQDPSGAKIIEIGACVGNLESQEVLESYSAFVNPQQTLQEFIIKLTGITQADVDNAGTLVQAYKGMVVLAQKFDCARMPLVWGMGDGGAIRQELPKGVEWSFGRRELDVKAVFQAHQMVKGEKLQAGLAKALTKFQMSFKGKKHRAVDDAINTFLLFCELLKRFK